MRELQAARGAALSPAGPGVGEAGAARRSRLLFVGLVVVGYALDLVTKQLALAHLSEGEPVRLLGGLLRLNLIFNPGAAFGMGQNATVVFSLLSIVVLGVVLWQLRRIAHLGWACALGLLAAGVCGNLTDRLVRPPAVLHGHVVDFLQLPLFPAIFNVADVCVTAAAVSIGVLSVFGRRSLDGEPVASDKERAG